MEILVDVRGGAISKRHEREGQLNEIFTTRALSCRLKLASQLVFFYLLPVFFFSEGGCRDIDTSSTHIKYPSACMHDVFSVISLIYPRKGLVFKGRTVASNVCGTILRLRDQESREGFHRRIYLWGWDELIADEGSGKGEGGRGKLEETPLFLASCRGEPVLGRSGSALGKYTADDAQSVLVPSLPTDSSRRLHNTITSRIRFMKV